MPSLKCRNEATRTPDPYVPNVVRYQLRYIPPLIYNAKIYQKMQTKKFLKIFIKIFAQTKTSPYLCTRKSNGAIAQLVEQRTENPCVPGSIPGGTTAKKSKKMKIAEFQQIQRFSFCLNCAKLADSGISIVLNSWLFKPLKKPRIDILQL